MDNCQVLTYLGLYTYIYMYMYIYIYIYVCVCVCVCVCEPMEAITQLWLKFTAETISYKLKTVSISPKINAILKNKI